MTDFATVATFADLTFSTTIMKGEVAEVMYPNRRGLLVLRNVEKLGNAEKLYTIQELTLIGESDAKAKSAPAYNITPAQIDVALAAIFAAPTPEIGVLASLPA